MHTATPWSIDRYGDVKSGRKTVFVNGFALPAGFSNRVAEENTDFIVRAVNNYESLIEHLEMMVDLMPDPELDSDQVQACYVRKARAAIAIAKGEQA